MIFYRTLIIRFTLYPITARPTNRQPLKVSDHIKFRDSVLLTLLFVAVLWFIKSFEVAMEVNFTNYGIYPRKFNGTIGIFLSPLIHGDYKHLFANTVPLVMLTIGLLYFYRRIAFPVFFLIYFMSGIWVWLVAREAYHIGSSGIVYGLVGFLLFSGLFRRDVRSIAIALIVVFLYGGMLQGIFPQAGKDVSFESHLMGLIAGVYCAFHFRRVDVGLRDKNVQALPEVIEEAPATLTGIEANLSEPAVAVEPGTIGQPTFVYQYKPTEKKPTPAANPGTTTQRKQAKAGKPADSPKPKSSVVYTYTYQQGNNPTPPQSPNDAVAPGPDDKPDA